MIKPPQPPKLGPSWKGSLLAGLVIANMVCGAAFAAPPSAADTEEQNRRARQAAEELRQREQKKDVFLQQDKKSKQDYSLPEETPSFVITTLRLEGNIPRFGWVQTELNKYANRRIGIQGINLIVKRLTDALIDKGYITTRILVPEQDLSTGTLKLTIVPGTIRNIRLADPATRANWRTAFPVRPGAVLNLRDLEQGLEQMKRVPSQDVDMKLVPGNQPGESDVVITVKQANPFKAVLTLDDSGAKATGKLQLSQTLAVDNLLGLNDLLNITFNSDGDRDGRIKGTRGDSLYFSLPYGNTTFSFSSSRHNYHQRIYSSIQPITTSGKSSTMEFKLSRLIHRDQTSKTHLDLGIVKHWSNSYIEDAEIEIQRKNTTALKCGLSHRRYIGKATLDFSVANKRGVPWLNAQPDTAGPDEPTSRFSIWTLDASLAKPVTVLNAKGRFSASLRSQYTKNLLFGSEFFSIGGRYTVRGFDGEQTLAAEKGFLIRNELGIAIDSAGTETYLGLDYGRVFGPAGEFLPGKSLTGAAAGIRGQIGKARYDVFVGWPLSRPAGFQTATPTYGMQLVCQF